MMQIITSIFILTKNNMFLNMSYNNTIFFYQMSMPNKLCIFNNTAVTHPIMSLARTSDHINTFS